MEAEKTEVLGGVFRGVDGPPPGVLLVCDWCGEGHAEDVEVI